MNLRDALSERLAALERAHLRRELRTFDRVAGNRMSAGEGQWLSFASNDYLGLASHPELVKAQCDAAREFGAGATASRLICGSLAPHRHLEETLASFKGTEAAIAFGSGYAAAVGVIPALVGVGDHILLDRLAHASLVDGARLSGARLRVFRHNDMEDLARLLRWSDGQPARSSGNGGTDRRNTLILTESVFSMDGDRAPLREMVDLKEAHGAWLMVDEAHATGLCGPRGQGLIEELGLAGRVEVILGTLGKAIGSAGGYVAGDRVLCDLLVHRARSFMFSTAPPPGVAAAAAAGVQVVASAEGRQRTAELWSRIRELHGGLRERRWRLPVDPLSAILPLHVGAEEAALRLSAALRDEGILIPAIRYPTVSRGKARLRVSVSASHTRADVERFLATLDRAQVGTGVVPESDLR